MLSLETNMNRVFQTYLRDSFASCASSFLIFFFTSDNFEVSTNTSCDYTRLCNNKWYALKRKQGNLIWEFGIQHSIPLPFKF